MVAVCPCKLATGATDEESMMPYGLQIVDTPGMPLGSQSVPWVIPAMENTVASWSMMAMWVNGS